MFVTVVTSSRSKGIGDGLTYRTDEPIRVGSLVKVPLRKEQIEGIVIETHAKDPGVEVKNIHSVLSKEPIVPEHLIALAQWMSSYYLCSLRQAFQVILPGPPWHHLLEETTIEVSLVKKDASVKGRRQELVLETLLRGPMERRELLSETHATSAVLRALEEKGLIAFKEKKKESSPTEKERSIAHAHLKELFQDDRPTVFLDKSFSGREATYVQIAEHVLAGKRSILILCPDVIAAKHMHETVRSHIRRALLQHGGMSLAEERRLYRQLRSTSSNVIVGTRSALFSPLPDIGAVIVDDEHAWTYKNEQTPRYHAVKTALSLCDIVKAKCILSSATPSLETFALSSGPKAVMHRASLQGKANSDHIDVVDLTSVKFGTMFPFSPRLIDALKIQLQAKKQSVLFLNHRGVASTLLCGECKYRFLSPEGLPLTVHEERGIPYLVNHQTADKNPLPARCPNCGSAKLLQIGAGTQRVEQLLKTHFPQARTLRVDRDAFAKHNTLETMLAKAKRRECDILVGTSPVLKALSLPGVTFAAALLSDIGMSIPDFRSGEENVQLLFSITRAMRAKPNGHAIIQTYQPDSVEVRAAVSGDFESYAVSELKVRSALKYPPFTKMIAIIVRGMNAAQEAERIRSELSHAPLISVVSYRSLHERQTWYVLLRGDDPKKAVKGLSRHHGIVDVDPMTTI